MSDTKYYLLEQNIIEKIDEITEKLESDIKERKKTNTDERYGKCYPWECLLEELKQIGIEHRREFILIDYGLCCDHYSHYPLENFVEKNYPKDINIFDETPFEKNRREYQEFQSKIPTLVEWEWENLNREMEEGVI